MRLNGAGGVRGADDLRYSNSWRIEVISSTVKSVRLRVQKE